MAKTQRPGRIHVGNLADRQRIRPDYAGTLRYERNCDRDNHILDSGAEGGDDNEGQDDQRKSQHHIHHPLNDDVEGAAEVSARHPQNQAQGRPDERRGKTDKQGGSSAVNNAGKDVAAEVIGAEGKLRIGRCKLVFPRRCLRVVRRKDIREYRQEDRH